MEEYTMVGHTDPEGHKRNVTSYDMHGIIDTYHPDLKDR